VNVSQREVMRKWTNMKFTCKAKGIPHPLLRAEQLDIKEVEKKLKLCQVRRKLISYSNNCNCALIIFGLKHTHPPTPHTHLSLSLCFTPDADMKSCRPVCPSVFMGKLKLPEQNQGLIFNCKCAFNGGSCNYVHIKTAHLKVERLA